VPFERLIAETGRPAYLQAQLTFPESIFVEAAVPAGCRDRPRNRYLTKRSLDGMRGKNEGLEGTFSGPDKSKNGFLQGAEVRGMTRIWR
jgi:hypothetical protein